MGAPGRPTPQRADPSQDRPRFRDVPLEDAGGVNPYVPLHRSLGDLAMPADRAWRWRDRWPERFGRTAPLILEIGPGNGSFLAALAARDRHHDHVAVEIRYKRVVQCARKLEAASLRNAVVCRYHAAYLDDLFPPRSLSSIWVNHPDPWPKDRHEKNRLISRWFLEDVASLLIPGGTLRLKSDHAPNIDRATALLSDPDAPPLPLRVRGRASDVTRGPAPWPDDIETGYQRKFRLLEQPVYGLEIERT